MTPAWITPDWPAAATVRALSTLREGGVSDKSYESLNLGSHVGDAPAAVAENRRRLRGAARLPAEPTWLSQVHGARVVDLDALDDAEKPPEADAALTRRPGRVCAILTADCLPVLLAAESGAAVAAAHAGWRGLAGGVIEAAVRALALARRRLARLGVQRIYGGGECTFSRADRYFSYRRDGTTGRQATLIWLENA